MYKLINACLRTKPVVIMTGEVKQNHNDLKNVSDNAQAIFDNFREVIVEDCNEIPVKDVRTGMGVIMLSAHLKSYDENLKDVSEEIFREILNGCSTRIILKTEQDKNDEQS